MVEVGRGGEEDQPLLTLRTLLCLVTKEKATLAHNE